MHILRRSSIRPGLAAALLLIGVARAVAGVVLITPEEAKLPPVQHVADNRAITRGPRIEVADFDASKLRSPLHFKLIFHAFGGSVIDPAAVSVTYLRGSDIDLTQRVRLFIQPTGIDIPDAEVPPGEHAIRVDLKDSDGRTATKTFSLAVTPN
jgi:hypothetical protein